MNNYIPDCDCWDEYKKMETGEIAYFLNIDLENFKSQKWKNEWVMCHYCGKPASEANHENKS